MNRYSGRRVLITGATGLIGSHLVRELINEGASVVAYGRSENKLKKVFYDCLEDARFSFKVGNISDKMPNDAGYFDYIFHAASPISGGEIKSKPVDTISANINGTINCLEYLRRQGGGRMIIFSSATVYGNNHGEDITVAEDETDKADSLHDINTPYSESKRMIEVYARAYAMQYAVDAVIVRIGYAYGYSASMPRTAFYEFVNSALSGNDLVLQSSGMSRRDNIYVDDVISGILLVAKKGLTGEAYNISSNGEKENYKAIDEIAEMIVSAANALGTTPKIKVFMSSCEDERKPGLMLDNGKIKDLGWSVTVSIKDGIDSTLKAYVK